MKLEDSTVVAVCFLLLFCFVLLSQLYMGFTFPPKIQTNLKILLEKSLTLDELNKRIKIILKKCELFS